ncbi:MAG: hypothetical protein ABR525_06510 [Candidatus Limnocylindria bacterium]
MTETRVGARRSVGRVDPNKNLGELSANSAVAMMQRIYEALCVGAADTKAST